MNRMTDIPIKCNNLNIKYSISIVCILLSVAVSLFSSNVFSIVVSPGTGLAQEQKQQNTIIDLDGRKGAKSLRNINVILSALDYDTAINKANNVLKNHPDSGLAYEVLGVAYILADKKRKGIEALNKAVKLEPDQPGALTKLGIVYMEDDRLAQAEKVLLKAIRIAPKYRYAHQRLGQLYEYQQKDLLAVKHYSKGLTEDKKPYLGIEVNLAYLLNKYGQYQSAVSVLEPRLPLSASEPEAQLVLATAYLFSGKHADAESRYQRLIQLEYAIPESLLGLARAQRMAEKLTEAQNTINRLLKLQPNMANAKLEEGEILLRMGKRKAANTAFDRAVSFGVKREFIKKRIAKFHIDRKEFERAQAIYQEMVDNGTADEYVFGQLSELLSAKNEVNLDQVEAFLQQGIKRFPDSGHLYYRLGSLMALFGQYEKSLPSLQRATELAPLDYQAWRTYTLALTRTGRTEASVEASRRVFELLPRNIDAAALYATRLEANKQYSEAEDLYRKIIDAVPEHALALNNLANLLVHKKKYKEAEKYARKAVDIVGENAAIQDTLAWVLYKQGRFGEALKILDLAGKLEPDSPIIWYHKGLVLAEKGRKTEAKKAIEKALSYKPKTDWVADARLKLNSL